MDVGAVKWTNFLCTTLTLAAHRKNRLALAMARSCRQSHKLKYTDDRPQRRSAAPFTPLPTPIIYLPPYHPASVSTPTPSLKPNNTIWFRAAWRQNPRRSQRLNGEGGKGQGVRASDPGSGSVWFRAALRQVEPRCPQCLDEGGAGDRHRGI